jgi:serine/threonine protein kinase
VSSFNPLVTSTYTKSIEKGEFINPDIFDSLFMSKEVLGEGSYKVVYKGTMNGQFVAIGEYKNVPSKFILKETTFGALLCLHPNAVCIYGLWRQKDKPERIVMEYINGKSLEHTIMKDKVRRDYLQKSMGERLRICSQLLSFMSFLHEGIKIGHGDIKLSNILITEDWKVKVSDFGALKSTSKDLESMMSTSSEFVRTNIYSSLELIEAQECEERKRRFGEDEKQRDIDWIKSDVYSLGCVLVEILTLKPIWKGRQYAATYHKQNSIENHKEFCEPPELCEVEHTAKSLLKKCFLVKPEKRPTSTELLNEFQ